MRRLTQEPSDEMIPSWSHDGRWIYFTSKRTGRAEIWKQPFAGGEAIQITREGGSTPLEDPDGRYLYYYDYALGKNGQGVWRVPVEGGTEEPVLASLPASMRGNWAVGRTSLYYIYKAPPPIARIFAMDLRTRATRVLGQLSAAPAAWDGGLAVSPDEKWILFAQMDRSGRDILRLDGFQ
jgi:Tol biopolymer transport system component